MLTNSRVERVNYINTLLCTQLFQLVYRHSTEIITNKQPKLNVTRLKASNGRRQNCWLHVFISVCSKQKGKKNEKKKKKTCSKHLPQANSLVCTQSPRRCSRPTTIPSRSHLPVSVPVIPRRIQSSTRLPHQLCSCTARKLDHH